MRKRTVLFALALAFACNFSATAVEPLAVDRVNRDGRELIVKTYELPPGEDPQSLIESDFEENGFAFSYLETQTEEVKSYHAKEIRLEKEAETAGAGAGEILGRFAPYLDYEEDGMTGRLYLDTASLNTRAKGYAQKSYAVTATKEYGGFAYADPSQIPRTVEKDGLTLNLTGISWQATGAELVGDSLLPNQYKAAASYAGVSGKSVPTGYNTAAAYAGVIEKTVVDRLDIRILYEGTEIPPDNRILIIILLALAALWLCWSGYDLWKARTNKKGKEAETCENG
jgi:hypothetical protein